MKKQNKKGARQIRDEDSNSEETDNEPEVSNKSRAWKKKYQKKKNKRETDRYGTETETDDCERSRAGKKKAEKKEEDSAQKKF